MEMNNSKIKFKNLSHAKLAKAQRKAKQRKEKYFKPWENLLVLIPILTRII